MGGSPEMVGWLAEGSPWKEILIAKGGLAIDQDNVEAAVELQVLESVIKDQEVTSQLLHGVPSASDAVLVDHHGNSPEILGKHEGFVSCILGVEQDGPSFRNNAHCGLLRQGGFFPDALVTPAQDRDPASPLGEVSCQFFNNRSLACSANGKITDADHGAAKLMTP